jgi:flagellar basal body-associated protein FliL
MEGGVALFLLLVILVIAAIAGVALYLTTGALTLSKDREKQPADEPRPTHEAPTSPTQEKVTFAGTEHDPSEDRS